MTKVFQGEYNILRLKTIHMVFLDDVTNTIEINIQLNCEIPNLNTLKNIQYNNIDVFQLN
jgi:hypothetical protein